jgi:hypothetical protein
LATRQNNANWEIFPGGFGLAAGNFFELGPVMHHEGKLL